ncbi:MAG: helix-turn-helix domain-containing protein [Pseudonocardia sp.]
MFTPIAVIGRNVRRFRQQRNVSASSLARFATISKATLLKIEQGEANPTVGTISALANALDVTIIDLLTESAPAVSVQRVANARILSRAGAELRPLSRLYGYGLIQAFTIRIAEGSYDPDPHPPGTLEHSFVIEGEVEVGPEGGTEILSPGDLIRFPADRPHSYRLQPGSPAAMVFSLVAIPTPPDGGSTGEGHGDAHGPPA